MLWSGDWEDREVIVLGDDEECPWCAAVGVGRAASGASTPHPYGAPTATHEQPEE